MKINDKDQERMYPMLVIWIGCASSVITISGLFTIPYSASGQNQGLSSGFICSKGFVRECIDLLELRCYKFWYFLQEFHVGMWKHQLQTIYLSHSPSKTFATLQNCCEAMLELVLAQL